MNNIWLDRDHLQSRRCGRELSSALACPGSLTEHLSQYCARGLTLQLLGEQWLLPLAEDVEDLPMDRKQKYFIREIRLACAQQPLIYGRSLFPRATYARCRGQLDRLGQRPLGEWLFSDPRIYRKFTQIGRIGRRSRLYAQALSGLPHRPDRLWGRRSIFIVSAQPLLVLEIFLPALITCIHTSGKSKTS